jgi:hypothetical protein
VAFGGDGTPEVAVVASILAAALAVVKVKVASAPGVCEITGYVVQDD